MANRNGEITEVWTQWDSILNWPHQVYVDPYDPAMPVWVVERGVMRGTVQRIEQAGDRVVITAGSRGIANIGPIIAATVEAVRAAGAEPFIVPAMGSHGGASPAPEASSAAARFTARPRGPVLSPTAWSGPGGWPVFFSTAGAAPKDADEDQIRKAYKKMAVKHHPDKGKKKYVLHSENGFHGKLIATGSISGKYAKNFNFPFFNFGKTFKTNRFFVNQT